MLRFGASYIRDLTVWRHSHMASLAHNVLTTWHGRVVTYHIPVWGNNNPSSHMESRSQITWFLFLSVCIWFQKCTSQSQKVYWSTARNRSYQFQHKTNTNKKDKETERKIQCIDIYPLEINMMANLQLYLQIHMRALYSYDIHASLLILYLHSIHVKC